MSKTAKTVRWSLNSAATNFEIDRKTLTKQIAAAGVIPGEDGEFSTADICRAVFGDLKGDCIRAQTRAHNELADERALNNAAMRGELIERSRVDALVSKVLIAIRATVLGSALERESKDDILRELQGAILSAPDAPK